LFQIYYNDLLRKYKAFTVYFQIATATLHYLKKYLVLWILLIDQIIQNYI